MIDVIQARIMVKQHTAISFSRKKKKKVRLKCDANYTLDYVDLVPINLNKLRENKK